MKRIILLSVLLAGLNGGVTASEFEFGVAPISRLGFGDTRFELAIVGYDADSTLVSGGSELIYPLDFVQGGIQFDMSVMENERRVWTAALSLGLALNDASSEMIDNDWDNVGRVEQLWSHTLSNVDVDAWEATLEVTRLLTAGSGAELSVLAGVTWQKMRQEMVDLRGWQYYGADSSGRVTAYLWDDNDLAGTYEVRYVRPKLGLVSRWQSGSFRTELQASISPLLNVSDIDDHVRRGFQIRTDGRGLGAGSRLTLSYESSARSVSRPFVALSGDYFKGEIDTDGTRNYYINVAELGISRGDRFAESHRVTSTQYGLQLAVGMIF
jgi:hypothetical protein